MAARNRPKKDTTRPRRSTHADPGQLPAKLGFLLDRPSRYKVLYGGRGGAKSWSVATALIAKAHSEKKRILCAREFQSSMSDSVHRLLRDRISTMHLDHCFWITHTSITSLVTGSEFFFRGLRHNVAGIRSVEGADIAWVEEAQSVSEESWQTLIPTIRAPGSEIWLTFNPMELADPTYKRFVLTPPPNAIGVKVNWNDNPWFPPELEAERRHMLATDPDAYEHVWGGHVRQLSEATIFRGRVRVEGFETPPGVHFHYGVDWGFAVDPTTMVRSFIVDDVLYIDHEAYAVGVEIDETAALFDRVPDARDWPVKADSARPETISYMRRQGFNIVAADKWKGCVEDGIAHMKSFRAIVIHERCKHTAQEFRLYSWKVDQKTGLVLPIIVDKHNHTIDAIRYSLDGYIQRRGAMGLWARLAS